MENSNFNYYNGYNFSYNLLMHTSPPNRKRIWTFDAHSNSYASNGLIALSNRAGLPLININKILITVISIS